MNVYTNEDYSKAYSEVLEVLRYIPKVDLVKIPKDEMMFYIKNMDNKHNYKYNFNKPFEDQKLMRLSKIIISNIYIKYLAKNKEELLENERKEILKLDEENRKIYNTDNIFRNKYLNIQEEDTNNENNSLIVIEKQGFFRKIIDKIRRLFKLT